MKIVYNFIFAFCLIFTFTSCNKNYYENVDFMGVYNLSQKQNKKLWVMLGGGDNCRSCNDMIDGLREKGIFKKYSNDYIFYKCNVMDTANIFLHYIFLTEQIPNSYIFNENGKLVFASYNNETINRIEESLKFCLNGGEYHGNQTQLPNDLASEDLLKLHNLTFKAHVNSYKSEVALSYIDSSINISPYFYNLYLKSKILNKEEGNDIVEKEAMLYYKQGGFQALLYENLYAPLKHKHSVDVKNDSIAIIEFKTETIDCGTISSNKEIESTYYFQNTGNKPLVIFTVKANCGCVDVKYSKKPIMPNDKSEIKVIFKENSKGVFNHNISILSNAENSHVKLTLLGVIK